MNSDSPQPRLECDGEAGRARAPFAGVGAQSFALACALAAFVASACVVTPADATNANATANAANSSNANVSSNANDSSNAAPTSSATPGGGATPPATPDPDATPAPAPPASAPAPASAAADIPSALLIPVAGIRAEDLQDTYTQSRSEGRTHNAIDIIAPRGTPVLAATDGTIVKFFRSERGGITLYQRGADGKTIYYYAHLDRYADGISENQSVRRGDLLGYVGDTGNSTPGNYHLHFAVWIADDPKRYWDGANLNPYPLLTGK